MPAKPYHHGDLRRALLDEALRTIETQGVEHLTLRTVGARLGVSRSALYRHFADKQSLLATVGKEGFRKLRQALADAWEGNGHGRIGFDAMHRAYVQFAVAHPSHYRVMFGADNDKAQHPSLAVAAGQAFGDLLGVITLCQAAGKLRGQEPGQVAGPLWSLVHGIASLAIDGELRNVGIDQDPEDMVADALSALFGR